MLWRTQVLRYTLGYNSDISLTGNDWWGVVDRGLSNGGTDRYWKS
jgi:hypothetical protein